MICPSTLGNGPAVQVAALVGGQLELVEVGLVGVAAHLEHADLLAGARELARDDRAAGTGADDADVGLDHLAGGARAVGSEVTFGTSGGADCGPG